MVALHQPTRTFFTERFDLFGFSLIIVFVSSIGFPCCEDTCRKPTVGFIILFVITMAYAFLGAVIVSFLCPEEIIIGLGLTTFICTLLTIFALQTKVDFTKKGKLLSIGKAIIWVAFIVWVVFLNKWLLRFIEVTGIAVGSSYIIFDIQLMMNGKHKYSISSEKYVFAAMNTYENTMYIFYFLTYLIGDYVY